MQRQKGGSSRPRQLGIIVTAVALVGVGGWFAGSQMQSPADAAAARKPPKAGPVTVAVEQRSLTASVVAQGSIEFDSPQSLALAGPVGAPDSGSSDPVAQRVTKAPVAGSEVKEGDVLMQLSGRPVLVLRGSVPMYRTLGPGTSGDDVKQLQRALTRLGFNSGAATGQYGQGVATAVSRWYKSKGFQAQEPSIADKQQLGTLEAAVTAAQQGLLSAQDPSGGTGSGDTGSSATDTSGSGTGSTETSGTGAAGKGGTSGSGTSGKAARLQLKAAQQQLDAANTALSAFQAGYGTKIPAGEVVFLPDLPARLDKVSVKVGDTPTGPIGTVTSSKVVVQAVVQGSDAKLLHEGMTAEVETTDGKKVEGELVALGDDVPKTGSADGTTAQGASGGGSDDASAPVPVQISLPAGKLAKNAGGSAKVTIKVGSSAGKALTVPIAALHTSADGQATVQVRRGGTVVDVSVKAGLSAEGQVEVTPSGAALKAGDQVVIGQ
ncbi:peptidoglycan-binding protein [Streptomyces sp. NBC_00582]|uniref:peptidoglycan-binding protein n=1 Tax=Streptomyces sp. NBC_00582 TaxID=2975783 RepID=UPI002E80CA6C|nr:peptidoglycan-binding protein [Streptomyces sp. NBC_00582]WUB63572.1 peptidoglycan-binding protein [Streptomyces sp. NBC_00582]